MMLFAIGTGIAGWPILAGVFYLAAILFLALVYLRADLFRLNLKTAWGTLILSIAGATMLWVFLRPPPPAREVAELDIKESPTATPSIQVISPPATSTPTPTMSPSPTATATPTATPAATGSPPPSPALSPPVQPSPSIYEQFLNTKGLYQTQKRGFVYIPAGERPVRIEARLIYVYEQHSIGHKQLVVYIPGVRNATIACQYVINSSGAWADKIERLEPESTELSTLIREFSLSHRVIIYHETPIDRTKAASLEATGHKLIGPRGAYDLP